MRDESRLDKDVLPVPGRPLNKISFITCSIVVSTNRFPVHRGLPVVWPDRIQRKIQIAGCGIRDLAGVGEIGKELAQGIVKS